MIGIIRLLNEGIYMKLIGTMIGTDDSRKLAEFYTKVFGKPVWDQDDWYGYAIDGGSLMIGPHSEIHGQSKEPARIMISISSSNVSELFSNFVECGAKIVAEPYQPSAADNPKVWLATVADPDGNYIQISTPWDET